MNRKELRDMIKEEMGVKEGANEAEKVEVQISLKGKDKILKRKQFGSFDQALSWIKTQGAQQGKVEYNVYAVNE
jgi:hypothetical protein